MSPPRTVAASVSHAPQQIVAGEMAGAVVVALEVVDVGERDAPAVAVALRPRLHRGEVLGEAVAVAQAGQRVLARVAMQAAVERGDPRGADEHALERLAASGLKTRSSAPASMACSAWAWSARAVRMMT